MEMNMTEQPIQNNYLQEISELRLPVRVLINGATELVNGRLLYEHDRQKGLFIRMEQGNYPTTGNVRVTCTYENAVYTFNSSIIGSSVTDTGYPYLQLQVPEKIDKEERRKFYRVSLSEQKPVNVSFTLPDGRIITVEALDLSGGGLSMVLPINITPFQIGQSLSLSIILPAFGKIDTNAVIKDMSHLLNMIRIGMAFVDISEAADRLFMKFIISREAEMMEEGQLKTSAQKARVCLIEESSQYNQYLFLDHLYSVAKIDFSNAIPRIVNHQPDLIVINMDIPEVTTIISAIRANQRLKYIPFLMVSSHDVDIEISSDVIFLNYPLNEKLFVKTSEYLIDKYRQFKKIQNKNRVVSAGQGYKIFIIDSFHKFDSKSNELLVKNGFKVIIDANEGKILSRLIDIRPDIIIFEEETDKTDPVSLCRLININKTIKGTPKIILISEEKNFARFYSQGFFSDYLVKPVDAGQLLAKIFELIRQDKE
jgi:c-di-GMP-binding flagellar brake protein YcgR